MQGVLQNASPEVADLLITLLEGRLDQVLTKEFIPFGNPYGANQNFLSALSKAVQIANRLPGSQPGNNAATQVTHWLLNKKPIAMIWSSQANDFVADIQATGNTDLPEALRAALPKDSNWQTLIPLGEESWEKKIMGRDFALFEKDKTNILNQHFDQFLNSPNIGVELPAATSPALINAIGKASGLPTDINPGGDPTKVPLYDLKNPKNQIISIDLAWIQNQAGSGGTVTVLPFVLASPTTGALDGSLFDVKKNDGSHVLIDGLAAKYALGTDPHLGDHPLKVDLNWHYNDFSDFQLNNNIYSGGTIYMLADNRVSKGANGHVAWVGQDATRTNGWKVAGDIIAGVAGIAGVCLAPVSLGLSLTITGAVLVYGGLRGWDEYRTMVDHGQQFNWSNPNARQAILSDAMIAASLLTFGAGLAASGLARGAAALIKSADTLSGVVSGPLRGLGSAASGMAMGSTYVQKVFAVPATLLGVEQVGAQGMALANGENMTPGERAFAFLNFALGVGSFASGKGSEYIGARWGRKPVVEPQAEEAPLISSGAGEFPALESAGSLVVSSDAGEGNLSARPTVRVRDPLTGNIVFASFPKNNPVLQALSDKGGTLGPEHIGDSLSLDAQGNVIGRGKQQSGPFILYQLADGTSFLLPRIAGGAPAQRPPVTSPVEFLNWVQDGFRVVDSGLRGVEGKLNDVTQAKANLNSLGTDVPDFVSKVTNLDGRVQTFTQGLTATESGLVTARSPLIDPNTGLPFLKTALTSLEDNQPRNVKTPAKLSVNLTSLDADVAALEGDVQPQLSGFTQKLTAAKNAGTTPAASSLWVAVRSEITALAPLLDRFKGRQEGLQKRLDALKLTSLDSAVQPIDTQRQTLTSLLTTLEGKIAAVDLTGLGNAAQPLRTEIGGLKGGDGHNLAVQLDLVDGQLKGFTPGTHRRQMQSINDEIVDLQNALTDLENSLGPSPDPLLVTQINNHKVKAGQAANSVSVMLTSLSTLEGQLPGLTHDASNFRQELDGQLAALDQQLQSLGLGPITARLKELGNFVTDSKVPLTAAADWRAAVDQGTAAGRRLTNAGTLLTSLNTEVAGANTQLAEPLRFGEAYPIRLWPNAVASIFDGYFQRGGDVHFYAVAIDQGKAGKPQSFAVSDIEAYGSVTPAEWEVNWVSLRSGKPIGDGAKTVLDTLGTPPKGKTWAIVASRSPLAEVQAAGSLDHVPWVLNRTGVPGPVNGDPYKAPGIGFSAGDNLIDAWKDKSRGIRPFGAVQVYLKAQSAFRIFAGMKFDPQQGWVWNAFGLKNIEPTDARYLPEWGVALVGDKLIPPQDDASNLRVADVHNHFGTFVHPFYIGPAAYLSRLAGATSTTKPSLINSAQSKIVITAEHIPYLVQRGGRWGPYTDMDVASINVKWAYLDDWKLLSQVEKLDPAEQALVIPSITGIETYKANTVNEYGSKVGPREYLDRILLYYHTQYPIAGELTVFAKELWTILNGRKGQTRIPLLPTDIGPTAGVDYQTVLGVGDALRDAGIVTVWHNDASFAQFSKLDARPLAGPGDDRFFFQQMKLQMELGPYDLSGLNFNDPNFSLSQSEIARIVRAGPSKRPLNSVVAHFMLGNITRASPFHANLVQAALEHPLLPHLNFDSSWLPAIEAAMWDQRNYTWKPSPGGGRPTYDGTYLDVIKTGRVFYGGDVVNFITAEQLLAPWYAQQPILKALQAHDPQLLNHYAGDGFMDLYNASKPAIDWYRYRAYTDGTYSAWIASWPEARQQSFKAWRASYESGLLKLGIDIRDPATYNQFKADDQVPGLSAPTAQPYPPASRPSITLSDPEVAKQVRDTFGLPAGSSPKPGETAWSRAALENYTLPDGTKLHPDAVQAGVDAAQTGFDQWVQLATVATTDIIAKQQAGITPELTTKGKTSDLRNKIEVAVASALLAGGGATAFWGSILNSPRAEAIIPWAVAGALVTRGFVNVLGAASKTLNRKLAEGGIEEGIKDPKAMEVELGRFRGAGRRVVDKSRISGGDGTVETVYRDAMSLVAHMIDTNVDIGAGERQEIRHAIIQTVESLLPAQTGRALGTEQASLEPSNFRTRSGQTFAVLAAIAYEAGFINAMVDVSAHPGHIYDYGIALGSFLYANYNALAAISGFNKTAWQELPLPTKIMSIGTNAVTALGVGTFGAFEAWGGLHGTDPFHNAAIAYTEAGFAGLAAFALAMLARDGVRAAVPKIPPQLFDPPRDSYPWTPKGIWNRLLPGDPGQPGVDVPRHVPKWTALAGLALIGIGGAIFVGLLSQHKPPTAAVLPPNGAQIYPQASANGKPLATFPQFTPLDQTGGTKKDDKGVVWVEVTWKDAHGKDVTGWVNATDVHPLSIVPGPGADIYSGPSLSPTQKIGVFAPNTDVTPTGHTQTDSSGNLWVEVQGNANAGTPVTGWVEAKDLH
jgi:hypothetical protein